jgi:hypothetical protein
MWTPHRILNSLKYRRYHVLSGLKGKNGQNPPNFREASNSGTPDAFFVSYDHNRSRWLRSFNADDCHGYLRGRKPPDAEGSQSGVRRIAGSQIGSAGFQTDPSQRRKWGRRSVGFRSLSQQKFEFADCSTRSVSDFFAAKRSFPFDRIE